VAVSYVGTGSDFTVDHAVLAADSAEGYNLLDRRVAEMNAPPESAPLPAGMTRRSGSVSLAPTLCPDTPSTAPRLGEASQTRCLPAGENVPLTGWEVRLAPHPASLLQPEPVIVHVPGSATSTVVPGLAKGVIWQATVTPINAVGAGVASNPSKMAVGTHLLVAPLEDPGDYQLAWRGFEVDAGQDPDSWTITWDGAPAPETVAGNERSVEVSGVDADDLESIRVTPVYDGEPQAPLVPISSGLGKMVGLLDGGPSGWSARFGTATVTTTAAETGTYGLEHTSDSVTSPDVSLALTNFAPGNVTPVVPGRDYFGTARVRAASGTKSVVLGIGYFDQAANPVGYDFGSPTSVGTSWTDVTSDAPDVSAPADAFFAVMFIAQLGSSPGDTVYIDDVALSMGTSTTHGASVLDPMLGTFEGEDYGWEGAESGVDRDVGEFPELAGYLLDGHMKATAGSEGLAIRTTSPIEVDDATTYRAHVLVAAITTPRRARIVIEWFDGSTAIGPPSPGPWRMEYGTEWASLSVTDDPPTGATHSRLRVEIEGAPAGEVHRVDQASWCRSTSDCM
jgi:hypothetical protein